MEELLYDLIDWTKAIKIINSEHDNPHSLLGAHVTEKGILINAFIPTAVHIAVKITGSGGTFYGLQG